MTDTLAKFHNEMIVMRTVYQITFGSRVSDVMQDTKYKFDTLHRKTKDKIAWIEAEGLVLGRTDGLKYHFVECHVLHYYNDGNIFNPYGGD